MRNSCDAVFEVVEAETGRIFRYKFVAEGALDTRRIRRAVIAAGVAAAAAVGLRRVA